MLVRWDAPPQGRLQCPPDLASAAFVKPRATLHSRCGGRMSRRNEAEDSAGWQIMARPQSPVMRLDDRSADRQPKSQTARFRGVKSFEHALKSRRREARPRISHLDANAIRFVTSADKQFPILFADIVHCFDGV